MEFWANPPPWIAAGATPEEAVQKLLKPKEESQVTDRNQVITLTRRGDS